MPVATHGLLPSRKKKHGWVGRSGAGEKKLEDGWNCMARGDEMSLPPGFVKLFVLHVFLKGWFVRGRASSVYVRHTCVFKNRIINNFIEYKRHIYCEGVFNNKSLNLYHNYFHQH